MTVHKECSRRLNPWLNVVFALLLVCVFVAILINDTCFSAVPIYPVAEKSCDLRVTFVNEACTNKQNFP